MNLVSAMIQWFANGMNKLFVRSKIVPEHPLHNLGIDTNKPTVYITLLNSFADAAALKATCKRLGLPNPQVKQQIGSVNIPRFIPIHHRSPLFGKSKKESPAIAICEDIFSALKQSEENDFQVIPVTILWGRNPGKEKPGLGTILSSSLTPSWLRKVFVVLLSGRDNLIRFSRPLQLSELTGKKQSSDLPQKLIRVARVHFKRQKLAALGPKLPSRDQLSQGLLASGSVKEAIEQEAKSKNISIAQARQNAIKLVDEIAANYNESMISVSERILTWLWNKLYNGIEVNNPERIQELTDKGHEIIYMPCHRSHMDYLLLTYVIYHQGYVPPHIAAGINLSFWPAGPIFRRCGAFFLRRSFKGNKLYSSVFREYLSQLFIKGYAVKFYTEGGRSRTGRLLPPKTGMLAMTLQSILRGIDRPISIVPVYIGYEHVMEVNTYLGELAGQQKKNESVLGVFKTLRKLKNYGKGNVNFGEPININQYLTQHQSDWRESINVSEKPHWLTPMVGKLADSVMVNINNAAAINAVTLISCILLNTEKQAMTRSELIASMTNYLKLLEQAPYSHDVSLPEQNVEQLLEHALKLDKFECISQGRVEVIRVKSTQKVLLNYYRNNVLHLFAVPSLISSILVSHKQISCEKLIHQVEALYPLFKQEWFMQPYSENYINESIDALSSIGFVTIENGSIAVNPNSKSLAQLNLLARFIQCTLIRYASVIKLILVSDGISQEQLEQQSQDFAKQLAQLFGIDTPEFFDKKILSGFISTLKQNDMINDCEQGKISGNQTTLKLSEIIAKQLAPSIASALEN
ncbi:glycerol-3-phosphate 1-O-acyltransferase PlsB [Pseudoalteromonas sp.]|uniref:glycerol-3-phosphate 1-O-acyltransferase PlsB n=1 Tax=Pseudoalteromonas sp. TaxID=53249 RepID=UPI003564CAA0